MVDLVKHGRLRWFGHLECENLDDLVSAVEMWYWQG